MVNAYAFTIHLNAAMPNAGMPNGRAACRLDHSPVTAECGMTG
jgi:hypothetical protein